MRSINDEFAIILGFQRDPERKKPEALQGVYYNSPGKDVPIAVGQLRRDPQYRDHPGLYNGSGLGVCSIVSIDGKRARVRTADWKQIYSVRCHRLQKWPLVGVTIK